MARDNLRGQKSLGPLKMSLELAHKVIVPQKKCMSRSFLNSGTLIVNTFLGYYTKISEPLANFYISYVFLVAYRFLVLLQLSKFFNQFFFYFVAYFSVLILYSVLQIM
jgi:hypothetical protein